jgi:(1->4)-alpha-D-glucan 1-alpha-D-glucosylmutase
MVASHDLPTFRGFWHETDLQLYENLGLFPSSEFRDKQKKTRVLDRIEIVAALERENLISPKEINGRKIVDDMSTELILPVHRYLARSEAMLMLVQLEDLFGQMDQINMPGTVNQYPNWRRKLPVNIEDWLDQGNLAFFALAITREREALDR